MVTMITQRNLEQSLVVKKTSIRNSIKITKRKITKMRNEINQYYDKNGYLSWSERKKKYIILGTNLPNNGLVECPECHIGKLMIIRSRKTKKRFIGCSNYYNDCRASTPLIQRGMICTTKISCSTCTWPIILFRYSRKQKWSRQCSNIKCESRQTKA